jgi:hypothetical protein
MTFDGYDQTNEFEFGTEPYEDPFTEFLTEGYGEIPDGPRHARRSVEDDLLDAIAMVTNAKGSLMSNAVASVQRDEMLMVLNDALNHMPAELREARQALREREALMYEEQRKAAALMEEAKVEAARLVEHTEIVRQSRLQAEDIIAEAHAEARRIVAQAEDFIDKKLAGFEIVLQRLLATTASGRERLQTEGLPSTLKTAPVTNPEVERSSFFDQDA